MVREVIRPLKAREVTTGEDRILSPGTLLDSARIRTSSVQEMEAGAEPYMVEFACDGRTYRCALAGFQPRTRMPDEGRAGELPETSGIAAAKPP